MLEYSVPDGAVRTIEMNITVTKKFDSGNGEQKTTYKAELDGEYLSFEYLGKFLKSIETINNMIFEAEKDESFVELEIVRFDYAKGKNIGEGHMVNYDRWKYSGNPVYDLNGLDEDERGLYFTPDKKYTEEHHDMFYNFTIESITA